jgi:hypothetical protein
VNSSLSCMNRRNSALARHFGGIFLHQVFEMGAATVLVHLLLDLQGESQRFATVFQ